MNKELERTTSQAQMDKINAIMMRTVLRNKEGVFYEGMMETMMDVAGNVAKHIQKQGSMDGLRVQIGFCPGAVDQNFYISTSLVDDLINISVTPERTADLNQSVWPSEVEGLVITREQQGDYYRYRYFLADKGPNWVEGS
ncbi:hypothetical protein L6272_04130 [Microgenomates group bacterium]|nr:hypothetical protein [Microgenomates group bacterium]